MRVLVLGGYGLIGLEVVRTLTAAGHDVVGLGRSVETGRRLAPAARWIGADIAGLKHAEDWLPHLAGVDAVVNASGVLQSGMRDTVEAVQRDAIRALIDACKLGGVRRFVQISAPGAVPDASSAFLRTKAAADAHLRRSGLDWVVFKPGLVIAPAAYGGTALLRMLAAFPAVQPVTLGDRLVQTVAVGDVCAAVACALAGGAPTTRDYDLVEPEAHTLDDVLAAYRSWLGFAPASFVLRLPARAAFMLARIADLAGWLGWRSALRTTALQAIAGNVVGDPAPWRSVTGRDLSPLAASLAAHPAGRTERIAARMDLVLPVAVAVLALFWVASGTIGLFRLGEAAALVEGAFGRRFAALAVIALSVTDIAIGIGFLVRPYVRRAAWAAVALSAAYLVGAAVFAPQLWLDPLGPMVKVLPGMVLALAVAGLLEER